MLTPVVADLGAGTGISARLLADRGAFVYAIEPNAAMRSAIPYDAHIAAIDGSAESTPLPDNCVDAIAAFQAYHWFKPDMVLREAARIGRYRARFAAVWNHRDRDDPFTGSYESIVDRYDRSGGAIDRDRRAGTVAEDLRRNGWSNVRKVSASHAQPFDWDGFIGFVRSCSYLPQSGAAYDEMAAELRALYDRESAKAPLRFAWIAEAYLAERPERP